MTAGPRRVAVVTGGGGGIGAAIAEAIGRTGTFVVTMDPLVTLDGAEQLPTPEETPAARIVAAGGAARTSNVSVTDGEAVAALFRSLVDEHGRLDAVVNVAGISRPTSFATGTDADWRSVLAVHLDGYRNVLAAALPIMAAAGHGRIVGVTSGSGWRAADTGAYGCAKRAVAALTWQLGRAAPPGVVVNAISPIAVTRMVTAALGRMPSGTGAGSAATGGLSLGSMPEPEELGPIAAHLVEDAFAWCRGKVLFTGGSEVALVDEPRLLEVLRTEPAPPLPRVLDAATALLVSAEAEQATSGGSNPRLGALLHEATSQAATSEVRSCGIVSDRPAIASAVTAALGARGVTCDTISPPDPADGFAGAADALAAIAGRLGALDALVLALAGGTASEAPGWEGVLAEHDGIVGHLHTDAGWARAAADHTASTAHPMRLLTLADATTAGGRSRGQSAAQHARAARRATKDLLTAFAVSIETPDPGAPLAELAAHLLCSPETPALSGAELVVGAGWLGLRSHPRPVGSLNLGGSELPGWFGDALRRLVGEDAR